jgi:hypothetical protein
MSSKRSYRKKASKRSKKGSKRSYRKKSSKRKSKYTKSGKLRLKSHRKGKRRQERAKRSARGCSPQSTKKYRSRKSPPYPANNCCGQVKKGNDGSRYKSISTKSGHCVWKKA